MDTKKIQQLAQSVKENIQKVIVGKDEVIDMLLVAMISSGHVLLEDVPGTGKTMLAKAMAKSLNCAFRRIQFTPDPLPSDISGINYFNQKDGEFQFRPGPLFANLVLADEINRATPRTQSSLLECMEERQISIDGETRVLESPFLVIATQNPVENQGTFPLPEAQLDRFLLKLKMGYPNAAESVAMLKRFKTADPLSEVKPVAEAQDIVDAQCAYSTVKVSEDLLNYIVQIVEKTRLHPEIVLGISPRGTQALLRAVQVYAILKGRDYVIPDDIKALIKPVFAHRMVLSHSARLKDNGAEGILDRIVADCEVPTEQPVRI